LALLLALLLGLLHPSYLAPHDVSSLPEHAYGFALIRVVQLHHALDFPDVRYGTGELLFRACLLLLLLTLLLLALLLALLLTLLTLLTLLALLLIVLCHFSPFPLSFQLFLIFSSLLIVYALLVPDIPEAHTPALAEHATRGIPQAGTVRLGGLVSG
jgi:hypothetical protein